MAVIIIVIVVIIKTEQKADKFLHSIGRVVISLSYTNESTDEWSRFTHLENDCQNRGRAGSDKHVCV